MIWLLTLYIWLLKKYLGNYFATFHIIYNFISCRAGVIIWSKKDQIMIRDVIWGIVFQQNYISWSNWCWWLFMIIRLKSFLLNSSLTEINNLKRNSRISTDYNSGILHMWKNWVGINTKTAKTVPKLPKLVTYLEMYPVLAFIPVYLPKLTELIGTQWLHLCIFAKTAYSEIHYHKFPTLSHWLCRQKIYM